MSGGGGVTEAKAKQPRTAAGVGDIAAFLQVGALLVAPLLITPNAAALATLRSLAGDDFDEGDDEAAAAAALEAEGFIDDGSQLAPAGTCSSGCAAPCAAPVCRAVLGLGWSGCVGCRDSSTVA